MLDRQFDLHMQTLSAILEELQGIRAHLEPQGQISCTDCQRAYAPTRWDEPEDRERKQAGPPCDDCPTRATGQPIQA
jgi:hypothetical protein